MLEGFEGEPEEDDGVEEAVQTMGPEDLQNRGEKDGGGRERWGFGGTRRFQEERVRGRDREKKKKRRKHEKKGCGEFQPSK